MTPTFGILKDMFWAQPFDCGFDFCGNSRSATFYTANNPQTPVWVEVESPGADRAERIPHTLEKRVLVPGCVKKRVRYHVGLYSEPAIDVPLLTDEVVAADLSEVAATVDRMKRAMARTDKVGHSLFLSGASADDARVWWSSSSDATIVRGTLGVPEGASVHFTEQNLSLLAGLCALLRDGAGWVGEDVIASFDGLHTTVRYRIVRGEQRVTLTMRSRPVDEDGVQVREAFGWVTENEKARLVVAAPALARAVTRATGKGDAVTLVAGTAPHARGMKGSFRIASPRSGEQSVRVASAGVLRFLDAVAGDVTVILSGESEPAVFMDVGATVAHVVLPTVAS